MKPRRLISAGLLVLLVAVNVCRVLQAGEPESADRTAMVSPQTLNYLVVSEIAAPFQITEGDLTQGGIVTEILESVLSGGPYQTHEMLMPSPRLIHQIEHNAIQNWVVYTAKPWGLFREQGSILDVPLFTVTHSVATCRNLNLASEKSIEGLLLAKLDGFHYLRLDELIRSGHVKEFAVNTYQEGLDLARLGRVDGFVEMTLRLQYHRRQVPLEEDCLKLVDFRSIIPDYDIYLMVDKTLPDDVKTDLTARIRRARESGEVAKILATWGDEGQVANVLTEN